MPTYTSFWLGIGADPEVYVDGAARFAMAGGDLPMSALGLGCAETLPEQRRFGDLGTGTRFPNLIML